MSGPVAESDVAGAEAPAESRAIEVVPSRATTVGAFRVRRALPHQLQTVRWLLEGEALHRDSLGSERPIRPRELNLMTAGRDVAHSKEGTGSYAGSLHGVQLWVAQPDMTRDAGAAFEHHGDLPRLDLRAAIATVLAGEFEGSESGGRRDTDHAGIDLELRRGTTTLPARRDFEYALLVLTGAVDVSIVDAHDEWNDSEAAAARFGTVASRLPPLVSPPPPWGKDTGGTRRS